MDSSRHSEVRTGESGRGLCCSVTVSCGSRGETNVALLMSEAVSSEKGEAYKSYVLENGQ